MYKVDYRGAAAPKKKARITGELEAGSCLRCSQYDACTFAILYSF